MKFDICILLWYVIRWGQLAASSVGCDNGEAQVHCLQRVSVERLLKTSRRSGPNGAQAVVDGSFTDFPFLPLSPREIMNSGAYNNNVSLLLGYNKDEGILHTADAYKNPAIVEKWKSKWTGEFGPSTLLGLKDQQINKNSKEISRKITKHYLGSVDGVSFENIGNITKMYTDALFGYPVHEFVSRRLSNKGKIFYQNSTFQYQFTHQGQYSLTLFLGQGGPYGAAHVDELFYMFSPFSSQNIVLNEDDKKMSNIILSLWKSFIKTGEPSTGKIIWDPILDSTSRQYLNLNLNSSMEYPDEIKSDMKFWDKIIIKLEEEKKKESMAQRQNKSNSNRTLPKNVVFALIMIFVDPLQ
jgi:carboxylesterase type B